MAHRPLDFSTFIGQERLIKQLRISVGAALAEDRPMSHCLFAGPPGLGKTTIAQIVANELGGKLISCLSSSIKKNEDLIGLFKQVDQPHSIIFIDEIEQLDRKMSELLHTALEDGTISVKTKEGIKSVPLPDFTMIGATNYLGELPRPFLDRFPVQVTFEPYDEDELFQMVLGVAKKIHQGVTRTALEEIAKRSRGVPRIALRFFERAREVLAADIDNKYLCTTTCNPTERLIINAECVNDTFDMLEIDNRGLDNLDRNILEFLSRQTRPIGVKAISQYVNEDEVTVEAREGYMTRIGMLLRTRSGREITGDGRQHLGIDNKVLELNFG
jgi:Holliday junction DNA helicase RuvB